MGKPIRLRFWFEAALGTITGLLCVFTLVRRDWIEFLFGVEPDGGSGELEWWIAASLLAVTLILFAFARYEWRRVRMIDGSSAAQ